MLFIELKEGVTVVESPPVGRQLLLHVDMESPDHGNIARITVSPGTVGEGGFVQMTSPCKIRTLYVGPRGHVGVF